MYTAVYKQVGCLQRQRYLRAAGREYDIGLTLQLAVRRRNRAESSLGDVR